MISGRVHSIQSLGTLDGPGVRFVVFMQGCNLRCGCCHNPDTWNMAEGAEYAPGDIVKMAMRYREYFGENGGITLSGGEPVLQPEFAREVFESCHAQGINTCLDTSGSVLNDRVKALLEETDRVLLDIKYTDDGMYRKNVGCGMNAPMEFLGYLNEKRIPVTLRQVIIPTLNDNPENVRALKAVAQAHPVVDKIELLPFRKLCQIKYDRLGMEFPFGHLPEPSADSMKALRAIIPEYAG
jgi:pyruvate formate lyase activating enzyme